jgi:hypothetical protein
LSSLRLQPDTWDGLKTAMHDRFVPPAYQHDLHKKLQHLDQGDMSVQDYYAKMQKGMIHTGVLEETEDKICHFYSGLRTKIQDITDYKDYNIVNHLFQLAILAKKELQGHQPAEMKTYFMLRPASTTQSRTATPSGARSSMTPSASDAPSMSSTPETTFCATDHSKTSILQGAAATGAGVKPSSSTVSTGCISDIMCHCCHGIGHF